jgi:hypothetical protein
MGGWELEFEKRAFDADKASEAARERRCIHYAGGSQGEFYAGRGYVDALQRLKGSEALRLSRLVEPFFWEDAHLMRVWLCRACSEELALRPGEHN